MKDLSLYVQFAKRDDDEHIVEGWASSEAIDSQGEVIKIEAIEKALPDYMKFANIREMHQLSAVGKTIAASIDKTKKALYIVVKVVDDMAWKKVKEGVYNGFSIGGRVLSKIENVIEELSLNEISLVDRPANPLALFSLVKIADGKVAEEGKMKKSEDEQMGTSVFYAQELVEMAAEVAQLIMYARGPVDSNGKTATRKTDHLKKALVALKDAATVELAMEKSAKNEDLNKANDAKKAELSSIAKDLNALIKRKDFDHNWSDSYFESMKKAV
ncbi:MAG: hypothetical protein KCHDKBKB_00592 [Elusimicrobia bacterium]|nr:hypothetical protein [Elusimicrobiota bacterium]